MTDLEAQAKDYAMSRKMNLSEPADITHVISLIETAYIAGSKGQWHDLRKNPADLPDLKNKYSSKVVITDKGHVAYYDYSDGLWYDFDFDYELETEVIAWCYFPSFEETEENDKRSS